MTDYEIPDEVYDPLAEALKMQAEIARLRAELDAERERNRWIPVGDRLPTAGDRVLLIEENLDIRIGYRVPGMMQWSTDEGHYFHSGWYKDITHWRELPEALP